MAHCQNCDFKWSWSDMMKFNFKGKQPCPNCHKNQYISSQSIFLATLIFTFPFVFFTSYLSSYQDVGWLIIVLAVIIYLPIASLFTPFFYKLSNSQNTLEKRSNSKKRSH